MTDPAAEAKAKKERSPSFPFISLRKAEERAKTFWDKHRREATRLATVAPTWGYQPKSSGLQQTVGALKQYGLLEDFGGGDDRKIQLSDLGRRLVADQRPGAREAALREAALRPRLFQEYSRWVLDPPSEGHRWSELELDRGFTPEAARVFTRAFDDTVAYARLRDGDSFSSSPTEESGEESVMSDAPTAEVARPQSAASLFPAGVEVGFEGPRRLPFSQRFKVEMTVGAVRVSATLFSASEVDKLIRLLEANKPLLDDDASDLV